MKSFVFLLLSLFLLSGCVLKSKHDETLAKELSCEADLKKMISDRDQLNQKFDESRKKLSDTELRNEEISQTNQMLVSKNADFAKRTVESQKEILKQKESAKKDEEMAQLTKELFNEWFKLFQPELEEEALSLSQADREIVMTIHEVNLFIANSDDFSPKGKKLLEKIVTHLKRIRNAKFVVEGHSDGPPPKSYKASKHLNAWEWTALRAGKVTQLLDKGGIEGTHLKAEGLADTQIETAANPSEKKNRRIEIHLFL